MVFYYGIIYRLPAADTEGNIALNLNCFIKCHRNSMTRHSLLKWEKQRIQVYKQPLDRMVTFTSKQSHRGCSGRKQNNNGRFQLLPLGLNKFHNGAQCRDYILGSIDDVFF